MKLIIKPLVVAITIALSSHALADDFVAKQASPALEAIADLTEKPFKQEAVIEEEYVSAEEQIQQYLEDKDWREGWDDKKKRMFVVYSESFDSENPQYDDSFITKRSVFATLATMGAKAKFVEFMRTEMSAVDQITAPGTDVQAALNKKYNDAINKINAQSRALAKLLKEVDAAEAAELAGVTWGDRVDAYADALIKKLDESYSVTKIEEKKKAKYEKVKKRYEDASLVMKEIEAEAVSIKGKVTLDARSMVETLAKAPLLGAVVLIQAESWDEEEEKYQVATLMVWSPKLEKAAKAIITGEQVVLKPKKALSVSKWLSTQETATLIGPRQYIDEKGERWFIGAYSMPIEGSSSLVRKNKGIADLMAKKETVMALYADIETQKQAAIILQTKSADLSGKDHTEVATSFAETTRQSIENRQVSGLSKLFSKKVTHPISGHKIYVIAYGISASAATSALQVEYSSFDAAATANRSNLESKANKVALDSALVKSKNEMATDTLFLHEAKIENKQALEKTHNKSNSSSNSVMSAPTIDEDDF
jgi:hypothetical protein